MLKTNMEIIQILSHLIFLVFFLETYTCILCFQTEQGKLKRFQGRQKAITWILF